MKSRRGVGGLISMIGLLVVFGVIGVAFLSLNVQQMSLFAAQQQINEMQHDRNLESFGGKVLSCQNSNPPDGRAESITIRVNNTSSQPLGLGSFILYSKQYQNVTDAGYIKVEVPSKMTGFQFQLQNITYDLDGTPDSILDHATRIIIVSDLGNKLILDYDFASCAP